MLKAVQAQVNASVMPVSRQNDRNEKLSSVEQTKETDRVAVLKEQVESGSYKLDTEATVKSVVKELLG